MNWRPPSRSCEFIDHCLRGCLRRFTWRWKNRSVDLFVDLWWVFQRVQLGLAVAFIRFLTISSIDSVLNFKSILYSTCILIAYLFDIFKYCRLVSSSLALAKKTPLWTFFPFDYLVPGRSKSTFSAFWLRARRSVQMELAELHHFLLNFRKSLLHELHETQK